MMDKESLEIDEVSRLLHNISGSVMGLSGRNANELSRQLDTLSRRLSRIVRNRTCNHQWKIDGQHSNQYCGLCFESKPSA